MTLFYRKSYCLLIKQYISFLFSTCMTSHTLHTSEESKIFNVFRHNNDDTYAITCRMRDRTLTDVVLRRRYVVKFLHKYYKIALIISKYIYVKSESMKLKAFYFFWMKSHIYTNSYIWTGFSDLWINMCTKKVWIKM